MEAAEQVLASCGSAALSFEVRYPLRLFVGPLHGLLQHYQCRAAHGQRRVLPLHHQREGGFGRCASGRTPCAWRRRWT
jgi:hypothetical protein